MQTEPKQPKTSQNDPKEALKRAATTKNKPKKIKTSQNDPK